MTPAPPEAPDRPFLIRNRDFMLFCGGTAQVSIGEQIEAVTLVVVPESITAAASPTAP